MDKITLHSYLKAHFSSLTVFDDLRYVETTAELQASADTQTQPFMMCPIQTHFFQLPAQSRDRERHKKYQNPEKNWDGFNRKNN